jgi:hypothetical protein
VEVEVAVVVEMYVNIQKSFAFLAEEALLPSFTPASTSAPFSRDSLILGRTVRSINGGGSQT